MGNESSSLLKSTSQDGPTIEDLPEEVLNIIFQKLDSKNDEEYGYDYDYGEKANATLISTSRVSKKWKLWIDGKILSINFSYMERVSRIIHRIKRFHSLKSVHFGLKNFDYAAIFSVLSSCPNLEYLSIPIFKNMYTILHTYFSENQNIKSLYLTYIPSSLYPLPPFDLLVTLLPMCSKLKQFELDLNLYDMTISELNSIIDCMPLLTHLNLQKTSLIDSKSVVYILQKCPLLKVLQLEFATIDDDALLSMSKSKNLEEIYLKSSTFQLIDRSIVTLATPNFNVHSLNLTRCQGLRSLLSNRNEEIKFPSLVQLNLSYCSQIFDHQIRFLMRSCLAIRYLDLSYTKVITNGIEIFKIKFSSLKILRMGGESVTDSVMELVSRNCQNLEELTLTNTFHITDHGIKYLINGCKKISILHIKNDREKWSGRISSEISGLGFDQPFPNLKNLILGRCNLTDLGLNSILTHCTGLTRFEFYLCNKVSSTGVFPFLLTSPKLKHFELSDCSGIFLDDLILHSIKYFNDDKNETRYNKLFRIKMKGTNKSDVVYIDKINNEWVYTPKDRALLGPYLITWFIFQNKTICLRGIFFEFDFQVLIEKLEQLYREC